MVVFATDELIDTQAAEESTILVRRMNKASRKAPATLAADPDRSSVFGHQNSHN